MPKKVINDYIFYKIVCISDDIDLCYVGSTADFNKRRNTHKNACYNENGKSYNYKIYQIIRENGGWCNFKMVQLGTKEQLTKREAEQVEEEYRQELKANMNSYRCYTTDEQKQEYYKDYIKEYNPKYREENKDYYTTYQQKYREANRVKNIQRSQNYREANREILNMKQKEKVKCECGCMIIKNYLSTHQKSQKHIKLMEMKTNENTNI